MEKLDEKHSRIIRYCDNEVENILKIFRRQKHNPPLGRMFPPLAGELINKTNRWRLKLIYFQLKIKHNDYCLRVKDSKACNALSASDAL